MNSKLTTGIKRSFLIAPPWEENGLSMRDCLSELAILGVKLIGGFLLVCVAAFLLLTALHLALFAYSATTGKVVPLGGHGGAQIEERVPPQGEEHGFVPVVERAAAMHGRVFLHDE